MIARLKCLANVVVSNSFNADSRRAPRYRLCATSPAVDVYAEKSTAGKKRRVRFGLAQRFSHDSSTVDQFTVDQRPVPAVARSIRWTGLAGSRSGPSSPFPRERSLGAADFAPSPARRGFRHWTTAVASARRADREDGTRTRTRARRAQTRRAQTRARAPFRAAAPGDKISPSRKEAPSLNARHANAQEAQGRG